MIAPRCSHCHYDLQGIPAPEFIAICPECGKRCDIREPFSPALAWWREPLAIGSGVVVTLIIVFALHRWDSLFSPWSLALVPVPGATLASLILLRYDLAAQRRIVLNWIINFIGVAVLALMILMLVVPSISN